MPENEDIVSHYETNMSQFAPKFSHYGRKSFNDTNRDVCSSDNYSKRTTTKQKILPNKKKISTKSGMQDLDILKVSPRPTNMAQTNNWNATGNSLLSIGKKPSAPHQSIQKKLSISKN